MKLSFAVVILALGNVGAFQPPIPQQQSLVVMQESSRWETVEKRVSLSNSGPGAPPARYDITFTPLPPRARDYEDTAAYYLTTTGPKESRWEEIEQRTSLRNSGSGALPSRYDIAFTPLHPIARDYERTLANFVDPANKSSRWEDNEKRASLRNSGAGAPGGRYDVTFTPLPPVARDYEKKEAKYVAPTGPNESRWDIIDKRISLGNSGRGAFPAQYDVPFTPLAPVAREFDRLALYHDTQSGPVQSRWDYMVKRTSFMNSGRGALPGKYDVPFTPLPPVARDFERTLSYYVEPETTSKKSSESEVAMPMPSMSFVKETVKA